MARVGIYSLADVKVAMYHQNVGQGVLSSEGLGKISITHSGDLSSHTSTADGYVVVNRLRNRHGMITLEVPQNSNADAYLRRWAKYLKNCQSYLYAATSLSVVDSLGGITYYCNGVTPQKIPERIYDQVSGNVSWVLLVAEITEG